MTITLIGMDTAKSVFQIHGVDAAGKAALRRKLRREDVIPFFEQQERCTVVRGGSVSRYSVSVPIGGVAAG